MPHFFGYNAFKEEPMRANIIIHSISGNLYLIADTFRASLEERGIDARIYGVSDPDLHLAANEKTEAIEYYEEITALPEATPEKLLSADIIILGSPSRFGMPTAEMKAFLDSTWPLYLREALRGRKFYAFASTTVDENDGLRTVSGLYRWAEMMQLPPVPYEPYICQPAAQKVCREEFSEDTGGYPDGRGKKDDPGGKV